mmetsp:Transcript_3425/g.5054  ORF Transcript_3425/g.5054 Transcript_3425/m.5054 type:complete len:247 (-) Transcript_3425:221-961(-)
MISSHTSAIPCSSSAWWISSSASASSSCFSSASASSSCTFFILHSCMRAAFSPAAMRTLMSPCSRKASSVRSTLGPAVWCTNSVVRVVASSPQQDRAAGITSSVTITPGDRRWNTLWQKSSRSWVSASWLLQMKQAMARQRNAALRPSACECRVTIVLNGFSILWYSSSSSGPIRMQSTAKARQARGTVLASPLRMFCSTFVRTVSRKSSICSGLPLRSMDVSSVRPLHLVSLLFSVILSTRSPRI